MRNKLVAGNWKMHGNLEDNAALLEALITNMPKPGNNTGYAVCVPFPYLASVQAALQGTYINWGAQNISQYEKGAYTGEVSADMLNDFGCRYVIVGHSERRMLFGETSQIVAEKYAAAQRAGLIPILCVGETLEQRDSDITEQVIDEQLKAVIALTGIESLAKAVIAYEPVWAIGTGKTATPQQAQDIHQFIRKGIASQDKGISEELSILYGGSVKANNAMELFVMPDIDGGLIGGASLVAEDFVAICSAIKS
ncbi:MAG: triose-phosphate isomerase [Nitrosomonas sp.]|nr:triose-phosphate isomerase [Nitrosomonas sp.]MCP5252588.1 triose-phosphate isomerase [Burkholderiales bacterium]MDR4519654.1 triose-phosphate isomerase [Nitrosomonas sp.]HQU62267.1 triose-phosphate isomerase [Nitrosomonas sp.]